jgi:hypothetical protein
MFLAEYLDHSTENKLALETVQAEDGTPIEQAKSRAPI